MPKPRRPAFRRAAARRRAFTPATSRGPATSAGPTTDDGLLPPTKAQLAELRRRVAELDDPTRYLIVSAFSRRFVLSYQAESECYVQNFPEHGTLFKNHDVAKATLAALHKRRGERKDCSLQILTARKTKSGLRILTKPAGLLDRLRVRRLEIENRKSKIEYF
jgi:hypothetical protein